MGPVHGQYLHSNDILATGVACGGLLPTRARASMRYLERGRAGKGVGNLSPDNFPDDSVGIAASQALRFPKPQARWALATHPRDF